MSKSTPSKPDLHLLGLFLTCNVAYRSTADGGNRRYAAIKIEQGLDPDGVAAWVPPRPLKDNDFAVHCVDVDSSFIQRSENGYHPCTIFQPMGPNAHDMLDLLPKTFLKRHEEDEADEPVPRPARYPKKMAKRILKQLLQSLASVHANGLIHGDVHLGNLLFSIRDISGKPEHEMKRGQDEMIRPLIRKDGKEDRWAPRYLTLNQPLTDFVDTSDDFKVKLADFASAWPIASPPPDKFLTPIALRAPEMVLEHRPAVSEKVDIWAFGCLLYELLTGRQLFWIWPSGEYDHDKWDWRLAYDSLEDICDVLGHDPPETMISANVSFGKTWLEANDKRKRCPSLGFDEESDGRVYERGEYPEDRKVLRCSLEERWARMKPDEFDEEETEIVLGLIKKILRWDPSDRPSAEDLLKEEWFAGV
jgi:serine/threonine protein kinase